MADVIIEREIVPVKVRRYRWPELLLSIQLLLLFVCGSIVLGSFAYFTYIQNRLMVLVPWFDSPPLGETLSNSLMRAKLGGTTF
jgi:hypothetical protein